MRQIVYKYIRKLREFEGFHHAIIVAADVQNTTITFAINLVLHKKKYRKLVIYLVNHAFSILFRR